MSFNLFATFIRKLSYPLVCFKPTYYFGMIMIRFGRILRKLNYKKNNSTNFELVKVFGNVKMKVGKGTYMGGSIYWCGMHHVNEVVFLKRFLKPNYTFVDVGANQGEFTLFAASKLLYGKVISFEPVTKQLTMLKDNIALNEYKNIEVNEFGLSEKSGELPIYTSLDTDLHHGVHEGLSSLYASDKNKDLEQIISLKVFDDLYYSKLKSFDILKIDIEGAELFALKGMVKSIEKFRPHILIEINEATFNAAGYSTKEVLTFFNQFGYKPYEIKKGNPIPVQSTNLNEWGNYLFKVDK